MSLEMLIEETQDSQRRLLRIAEYYHQLRMVQPVPVKDPNSKNQLIEYWHNDIEHYVISVGPRFDKRWTFAWKMHNEDYFRKDPALSYPNLNALLYDFATRLVDDTLPQTIHKKKDGYRLPTNGTLNLA